MQWLSFPDYIIGTPNTCITSGLLDVKIRFSLSKYNITLTPHGQELRVDC